MKNRTEDEMISAYQRMVNRMEVSGLGLKHHRLDNECSEKFKQCIRQNICLLIRGGSSSSLLIAVFDGGVSPGATVPTLSTHIVTDFKFVVV
jgi:hypothetical protein